MQEVLPATLPRPRENETGTAKNEVKSFKTKLINLAFHLQATGSQGRFLVTVTITAAPSAGRAASDAAGRVPRRKAVRVPRAGLVMGPWSGWTVGKESGRRHSRRGTIDRTRHRTAVSQAGEMSTADIQVSKSKPVGTLPKRVRRLEGRGPVTCGRSGGHDRSHPGRNGQDARRYLSADEVSGCRGVFRQKPVPNGRQTPSSRGARGVAPPRPSTRAHRPRQPSPRRKWFPPPRILPERLSPPVPGAQPGDASHTHPRERRRRAPARKPPAGAPPAPSALRPDYPATAKKPQGEPAISRYLLRPPPRPPAGSGSGANVGLSLEWLRYLES